MKSDRNRNWFSNLNKFLRDLFWKPKLTGEGKSTMTNLVRFSLVIALCLGRYLGSEGTAIITGPFLILYGIVLLSLIFLYKFFYGHLKKKYGLGVIVILHSFFFLGFFILGSCLQFHIAHVGLGLTPFLFPLVLSVGIGPGLPDQSPSDCFGSGSCAMNPAPNQDGQPTGVAGPSNAGPSSGQNSEKGSDWKKYLNLSPEASTGHNQPAEEPLFEVNQPQAGPVPPASVVHDSSLECSMRHRICALSKANCPFFFTEWTTLKDELAQAPTQEEYNNLLELEHRDLQIKEGKQRAWEIFKKEYIAKYPDVNDPEGDLSDFFNTKRDQIENDKASLPLKERDKLEIEFLESVAQDLQDKKGSRYIKEILREEYLNQNRADSPLDQFAIVPFLPLKIGKFYFSFTNASFFLLLTLSFVLFYFHLVTKKGGGKLVPNAFQSVLELIYDFVLNLVNEQIGGLSGNVKQQFFPCILVTFTFLLFCNLQGMIPYSFTVTSHFIVTLGLSFSLFIGITIVGFVKNGLHFLSFLLPAGVPLPLAPFLVLLELISYCFRALSLGIRLFANMMAGHSLVKILSGFAWTMLCMNDLFYFIGSTGPFFIVLALTGLELGVAILQAYVFTILICIYLNDAINLH